MVTGANGLLGRHLIELLLKEIGYTVTAVGKGPCRLPFAASPRWSYSDIDLTDGVKATAFYTAARPDVMVHAAAKTQVDDCELHPVACWDANVTATRFLVSAAQAFRPFIIFLSTDFVFDGHSGPYKETDTVNPVSYYGSSKVAGEKDILQSGLDAAVVRTCLVYGSTPGGTRSNIISWVRDSLAAGKPIKVVDDQWRTPTWAGDLARGILLLVQQRLTGIYHLSGKDLLTPYRMALATAAACGLDDSLIEPVTADTFSQPAQRPAKTGFFISKAVHDLGYHPLSFSEGLAKMLGQR